MLTGDKGETAMEIGQRCGLYNKNSMSVLQVVETTNEQELFEDLSTHVQRMEDNEAQYALAVAGKSLPIIYESQ